MFKAIISLALLSIISYTTEVNAAPNCGVASWYGNKFHGNKTASGERFDQNSLTAAHRHLPFNTKVLVTHGNKSIILRVNDRGPFTKGRVLDISKAAAVKLNMKNKRTSKVCFKILKKGK